MEYLTDISIPHPILSPGISVGFDPILYSAIEGVDDSVTLRVVKTGIAAIPVTATVTTQQGTAEGWAIDGDMCDISVLLVTYKDIFFANRWYRLWRCCDYSDLCTWRDTAVC